jgi:hypothetical protein
MVIIGVLDFAALNGKGGEQGMRRCACTKSAVSVLVMCGTMLVAPSLYLEQEVRIDEEEG